MSMIRLLLGVLLLTGSTTTRAFPIDDDWKSFSLVIGLVKSLVGHAAGSDDPRAVQRGVEGILSGRDAEVNRLLADMFEDLPREHRSTVLSIGRDLATISARESAKAEAARTRTATADRALAARKDLAQMGLRYHDATQFLDSVKRDDLLAVELFMAGRGVNLAARNAAGESALDFAKRTGNPQMIQLLAAGSTR